MGIVLKGAYIVKSEETIKSDIRIENEIIKSIGYNLECHGDEIIDVSGCYILPGAIDAHTHFDLELPNIRTTDNFQSGTKAAIAGGTTTIIDFVNCHRGESLNHALDIYKEKTKDGCYSNYSFHMTLCEWSGKIEKEMENMVMNGITSFKMYLAYKNTLQVDEEQIRKALEKAKTLGALISFHCENGDKITENIDGLIKEGKKAIKYHETSRDSKVELEAVKTVINISKKVDYPVFIVHLSSKLALEEIRKARADGVKVFVETCPHYLLLDKSLYDLEGDEGLEGAKYVMSPPLREKTDNETLWKAIKNGEIDTVATDHCSFNYSDKRLNAKIDFSKIPNGIPSVEQRLQLMYSYGVCKNLISINDMVKVLSTNPAKIFGLYPNKGEVLVGSKADLVVIKDTRGKIITKASKNYEEVDYTPYEGFEKNMDMLMVLLNGKKVVENGVVLDIEPSGKYISRNIWS